MTFYRLVFTCDDPGRRILGSTLNAEHPSGLPAVLSVLTERPVGVLPGLSTVGRLLQYRRLTLLQ